MKVKVKMIVKLWRRAVLLSKSETKDMKVKENLHESESEDNVREGQACRAGDLCQ